MLVKLHHGNQKTTFLIVKLVQGLAEFCLTDDVQSVDNVLHTLRSLCYVARRKLLQEFSWIIGCWRHSQWDFFAKDARNLRLQYGETLVGKQNVAELEHWQANKLVKQSSS